MAQKLGSPEERETAETEAAAAAADQRAAEVAVEELKQQEIQLEFKRQDVKTAEAALQADRITLDQQKQQLAYTTVTAADGRHGLCTERAEGADHRLRASTP